MTQLQPVRRSTSRKKLENTLQSLLGVPCVATGPYLQSTIYFELGSPQIIQYSGRFGDSSYILGDWSLNAQGSDFELRKDGQLIANDFHDFEDPESIVHRLVGSHIENVFSRDDFGVRITFSVGYELEIMTSADDADYPEIPCWTLDFNRDNMALEVGFGKMWSFLPFQERRW